MNDFEERLPPMRIGVVSKVSPETGEARVVFDDLDGMETDDLPVLFAKTLKDRYFAMPDVGEHVACLMDERFEAGVILGAVYDDTNLPPEGNQDRDYIRWGNGAVVEHDRKTGRITINTPNDVEITAANAVTIKAATVTIDSPQTICTGQLTVQGRLNYESGLSGRGGGSISGDVIVQGGDVKADNITLKQHVHGGVDAGGDRSGQSEA